MPRQKKYKKIIVKRGTQRMDSKNFFVHESSYIDEPCEIGEGTKIWHFSHIMPNCKIGKNFFEI